MSRSKSRVKSSKMPHLYLEDYLSTLQATLRSLGEASDVHITIGNESCDLDSIACAVSHAYFLATQDSGVASLPVLQCSSVDFALRTDVVWLFDQLKFEQSQLLYSRDVIDKLKEVRKVFVTLVDHALPTRLLHELPNMEVVQVIDHHNVTPLVGDKCHNVVEPVGSCATLVAEKLLGVENFAIPAAMATLLLGAILLDTVCLDAEQGRVSDKDKAMAKALDNISEISSQHLYSSLSKARFSTAGLTIDQLLYKDFKCSEAGSHCLGFCSVTCLVDGLLDKDGLEGAMHSLCCSQGLSALLILGVKMEADAITRQIAIYQPEGSDVADAVAGLLETDPELECQRLPAHFCILLGQGNTKQSRKYILPSVVTFISSLDFDEITHGAMSTLADLTQPPLASSSAVKDKRTSPEKTVPEYTVEEESRDVRSHRLVSIKGEQSLVNMDTIQPFRKIIQHGGYSGPERHAVLVISACYLPPHSIPHYPDTVDHLFLYVMSVVQRLVVDDYIIVYLHSGAPQHSMPSISIFHKFYRMVDRRLRKQLQHLYIVHPTFWVRSMLKLARPFISSKFYRKVHLVHNLKQLSVPLEHHLIPAPVALADSAHQPRPSQPSRRYTARSPPPT